MYLSWATFYEGSSDADYFNVLIPRLLESILNEEGVRPYDVALAPSIEFGNHSRDFDEVAQLICDRRQEFDILVVHSDLGGRALATSVQNRREALVLRSSEICGFEQERAVMLSPKKELEAWALADGTAICAAFGITRLPLDLLPRSPKAVETLDDPKIALLDIGRFVGQRRPKGILVRIAQEQSLATLRRLPSFQEFETSLRSALMHQGCLPRDP